MQGEVKPPAGSGDGGLELGRNDDGGGNLDRCCGSGMVHGDARPERLRRWLSMEMDGADAGVPSGHGKGADDGEALRLRSSAVAQPRWPHTAVVGAARGEMRPQPSLPGHGTDRGEGGV